jgi:tetratricopeptide (TPR) repeat protein
MARHLVANRLRMRGRFAESSALADEALAIHQAGAVQDAALLRGFAEYSLRFDTNRLSGTAHALTKLHDLVSLPIVRAGLAAVLAEEGQQEAAAGHLDQLLACGPVGHSASRDSDTTVAALAAWAACRTKNRPVAQRLLVQLQSRPDAYAFSAFTFAGWVGHHVGALLETTGRASEAVSHLEAAIDRYRRDDIPVWEIRACRDLARALEARGLPGDRARSRELELRARAEAARLGLADREP